VQINVECPVCQTKYFLQRDLIGKSMRCSTCDEFFAIQEFEEPPMVLESAEQITASLPPEPVGELIMMLPAEAVEEPPLELEALEPFRAVESAPIQLPEFIQADLPYTPERTEHETAIPPDEPLPLLPVVEPTPRQPVQERTLPEFQPLPEPGPVQPIQTMPASPPAPAPTPPKPDKTVPVPRKPISLEKTVVTPKPPMETVPVPKPAPPPPAPAPAPLATAPAPVEMKWSPTFEPPQPREAKWTDLPPPPVQGEVEPETRPLPEKSPPRANRPVPPRPRPMPITPKKKRRKGVLIALILFIIGGLAGGGLLLKSYLAAEPERLFAKGKKEYEAKNFGPAVGHFEQLMKDYPDFPRKNEAKFFLDLSTLRKEVDSIATLSDPQPAMEQVKSFLTTVESAEIKPFASPEKFGSDIWQTLNKLADDIASKAKKEFDQDQPHATELLVQNLETLRPMVSTFRPKDLGNEAFVTEIAGLKSKVAAAKVRQGILAQIDQQLLDPDDEKIAAAKVLARSVQLEGDPAVVKRLEDAEKKLQGQITYKRYDPPQQPQPLKDDGLTGLLFAPRIDVIDPLRPAPPPGTGTVYFAVARGMLYALDEQTGRVRWATRVGIDTELVPLRIPATESRGEMVLVAVSDGTNSSLTARLVATGEIVWSQPLESSALGNPILVGNRVFLPLKDAVPRKADTSGVIYEIEINSGLLLGRLRLGRPLAAGGVRQPGSGLIYFPAEAKSVYVFDMLKLDPNGTRLDPQFLGVIATEHMPGTLRSVPVLSSSEADAPGPRYLLLCQTEGLNEMKLRAFPLPPGGEIPRGGIVPVEIKLNGWSWFAPYCDGERLAVVTDRGEFGLFGINQAGNQDAPIFSLPPDAFKIPRADTPSRGQLIHAEEGTFWILARGEVKRIRIGLDAAEGIKVKVYGNPIPVGEPMQAPQVTPRGDGFVLVTQQADSSGCLATFIEMPSGTIRWQRQIGMMSQGSPVLVGEKIFAVDQDCGLYQFDAKKLSQSADGSWLLDDSWLLAAPLKNVRTPPELFPLADGKGVLACAMQSSEVGPKLLVRTYQGIDMVTRSFPLAGDLAGPPVLMGNHLLVPLTTGTVFRIEVKELQKLEEGPSWRNNRLTPEATCKIAALSPEEFLVSDGNKSLLRFKWTENFEPKGTIAWPEKFDSAISTLPRGDHTLFCFSDVKGAVAIWDSRQMMNPKRVWRGSDKGPIPTGVVLFPTLYSVQNQARIGFAVHGRTLVWVDPEKEAPLWIASPKADVKSDGLISAPALAGDRLLFADRAGWFQMLNLETGQWEGKRLSITGNIAPTGSPLKFAAEASLAPVSDGTLLLIRSVTEK
jgi:hypothetical protein